MLTYNISEFLHGRIDREIVIKTLDKDESNDGHQRLLRSTKRFLLRYSQFTDKVHGNGDFLAALRDFIFLAGGFVLPNHLARIVKEHGQDFGLYLENDNFVKAELGKLDSLVPRVFLNDIYDLNYKLQKLPELCTKNCSTHSYEFTVRVLADSFSAHGGGEKSYYSHGYS